MEQPVQGFTELIAELKSLCYTRAVYSLSAENAFNDFGGLRTENGVLLFGKTIAFPTVDTDLSIQHRFYRWLETFPSVVIIVRSLLEHTNTTPFLQTKEVRGYVAKILNNQVSYYKIPGSELERVVSIDPRTGKHIDPGPLEIFM